MARYRKNLSGKYIRYALLILALLCAYYFFKSHQPSPRPKAVAGGLTALKIIDGDTFTGSDGQTVRLLGIDTPEKGDPYCDEAGHFLDSVLHNETLHYEYDHRSRDRYGRLLAYVFVRDDLVNAELVRAGLAAVYIFPEDMKNLDYRKILIDAQREALQNKRGLWSLPIFKAEQEYIGNPKTLRFHRPSCKSVSRLGSSERIVKSRREEFLDLGFSPCRNCKP